jgi:DNA primase
MALTKVDIEAVKAGNPILQVLQDLGIVVQHNRFRCPRPENHKHGDRTPSATVWPEKGAFKCWVCPDVKGDVIDLVRLVNGCSFKEALDYLDRASLRLGGAVRPATGAARENRQEQTQLFAAVSAPGTAPGPWPAEAPHGQVLPGEETPDALLKRRMLAALLDLCPPVGGKVARYLQKRRIFRRTWIAQGLKRVEDYAGVSRELAAAFGVADLERMGFFNPAGHLRFYRHCLLFPYCDRDGKPVYLQARAIEGEVKPKELSLSGPIPIPYNARLLDGEPGQIYLCEGVIDTLTMLEQGFPAVGIPGAANFKAAWAELFRRKIVHVAFDHDVAGDAGAAKAIDALQAHGVEARRLAPPPGMDLNDWFRKG